MEGKARWGGRHWRGAPTQDIARVWWGQQEEVRNGLLDPGRGAQQFPHLGEKGIWGDLFPQAQEVETET